MTSPYLTAHEAADYVKKTYKGFDHWVRQAGVRPFRVGRHRRFTREQLDRAIKTESLRRSA